VLVIDDCSTDDTIAVARQAGAEVLPMPTVLVSALRAGSVQACMELGSSTDPRGWRWAARRQRYSHVFEKLKTTGCEMVIGSRFVAANGSRTEESVRMEIAFFVWSCGRS